MIPVAIDPEIVRLIGEAVPLVTAPVSTFPCPVCGVALVDGDDPRDWELSPRQVHLPVRCRDVLRARLDVLQTLMRSSSVLLDQAADVMELANVCGPVGLGKLRELKTRIDQALGLQDDRVPCPTCEDRRALCDAFGMPGPCSNHPDQQHPNRRPCPDCRKAGT